MKNLFKGKYCYIYLHQDHVTSIPFNSTVKEIKSQIKEYKLFVARKNLIASLNKRVIQLQPIDYNGRLKELILTLSEDFELSDILDFILDVDCGYDYGESELSLMKKKLEEFFNT